MPFVKLDTGILDSSLWSEPAQTCKCWVTLLAMMDSTGLVRSTAPGIAKRAHLSLKHTVAALATFEAPDEHSRSLNDEGRRIKRIDGGYQVINSEKYRKYDYTAAERMKRHRQRVTRNGCNETVTLRKQKQKQKQNKDIGENGSRPTFDLEKFLSDLEKDRTYAGINIREQYGKMLRWCEVNKKQPTQRRFINWLNRTDRPLRGNGATKVTYKVSYLPPAREPTAEEIANARAIAKRETESLREKLRSGTA